MVSVPKNLRVSITLFSKTAHRKSHKHKAFTHAGDITVWIFSDRHGSSPEHSQTFLCPLYILVFIVISSHLMSIKLKLTQEKNVLKLGPTSSGVAMRRGEWTCVVRGLHGGSGGKKVAT